MEDLFLGIDLGGTNAKIGLCTKEGEIRGDLSIPTEGERGFEDTIRRMCDAARGLMKRAGPAKACGSGVPGPLDVERHILINAINLFGWKDVPYPDLLSKNLGMPVLMENDANSAAWGEFCAGAGRGTKSLALYTLGTGVGGGLVINGELWIGVSGMAGEFGHMTIIPDGPRCGCGQLGCLETYASATAVASAFGRGDAKAAFDAARRGDATAIAAIKTATDALTIGIGNMIHVFHPEIVVLAGGMADGGDLLFDPIRKGVRERVFPAAAEKIRIEPSQLGDDAGWLGAALLAARRTREPTP